MSCKKVPLITLVLASAIFGSSLAAKQDNRQALTEKNRAIITEYARLRGAGATYEVTEKYDTAERVEHNPEISDGLGGDRHYLEARREAHPDKYDPVAKYVNVVHSIIADGDLVAVKSHLFASANDPGREFLDMWRLKDGKFVEHWDVIQPIAIEAVKQGLLGCGAGMSYTAARALTDTADAPTCGRPDRSSDSKANRKLVMDYMRLAERPEKFVRAVDTYVADGLVQHNPTIPSGREGLLDYLSTRIKARQADHIVQHYQHVIADGDMVMVHRWQTSDSDRRGTVYIDLFRLKDSKIVEHWDIAQQVPPFSLAGHSMSGGPASPLEPGRRKGTEDGK